MLTKIVPYASFPYADHALREVGVEDPNLKAETTDAHIDKLIEAAQHLRSMVQEMENLEEIQGFITYVQEEEKESMAKKLLQGEDGEEENKVEDTLESV